MAEQFVQVDGNVGDAHGRVGFGPVDGLLVSAVELSTPDLVEAPVLTGREQFPADVRAHVVHMVDMVIARVAPNGWMETAFVIRRRDGPRR